MVMELQEITQFGQFQNVHTPERVKSNNHGTRKTTKIVFYSLDFCCSFNKILFFFSASFLNSRFLGWEIDCKYSDYKNKTRISDHTK